MPAVTGPALVAAALLALAGAQKVLDPAMTVGALRALRLPASPGIVRVGAAVELALGVLALGVGGPVIWWLVAASYLAFGGFVLAALQKGTMIGSCGCFGREDTPPHPTHVVLNIALAAVAVWASSTLSSAPIDELRGHPAQAVLVVVLSSGALYLLYAAYVVLPRARNPVSR